ncbi:hypothetical protein BY996DRAFT_6716685 [Phakopsora pachyrhizi]|nr:hypothetical protein BY996DRAFT_6716685 [Phakopsora pachyrhizi]
MNHEESFAYSPLTEYASNEFPASTIKFEKELPYTQGKIETCIGPFSEAESWLSNFPSPFHDSDTAPNQLPGSTIQLSAKNKNGLYSDAETWLANFPSPFQDSDTLPPQRPESHNPVNAKNDDEPYSVYSTEVDVNNNEPLSRAKSWLSNFPSPFHESDTLPNQCPKSHTQVNAKSNNGPIAEAENLLSNIPSPVNDFGTFLNQLSNYQAHPTNYPAYTALPTTQIEIPGSGAGVIHPASFDSPALISPAGNPLATTENHSIDYPSIFLHEGLTTENPPAGSAKKLRNVLASSDSSKQPKSKKKELEKKKRLKKTKCSNNKHTQLNNVDISAPAHFTTDVFHEKKQSVVKNGNFPEEVKENYFATPIGGSIDYKLNLYHTLGLNVSLFIEEIKKLLSAPGFSYHLFQATMVNFYRLEQILNDKAKKLSPIRLKSPISNENFWHFNHGDFRLKSEVSVNEIIGFVQETMKQNGLPEKITLDDYIVSIFSKAGLENLEKKLKFENPTEYAGEEALVKPNDAFKYIIALHKHMFFSNKFSLIPLVSISINERVNKKVLNEISVQLGLKRLKSLGLENKLNFIEELKEKFDGKMKKTIDVDIDWCESAVRIVSAVSNRIILISRIFSPFDKAGIESLRENLLNFIDSAKVFFFDFYSFLTAPDHKFKGHINLLDQDELVKSYKIYKKSKTFVFEHSCNTKIFLNWVASSILKSDSTERQKFKQSKLVNYFLTNCILIDFNETYEYPLNDYLLL